ncbi:MAG: FecCD family ABC transporter permease [Acidobacteriota bacterium]
MKGQTGKFLILLFALASSLTVAILIGSESISFSRWSDLDRTILFDIRIPRVLLGAGIGAALAVSGAALQALLRNPLAEPYLLGVSNGAALGTMLAIFIAGEVEIIRPVFAFIGAVLATVAVYQMARSKAGMNVERLVLSGVIVTTMLSSIIVLLTSVLDAAKLRSFTFWLLGDLSQASKWGFILVSAAALLGTAALLIQARSLNLLMIGERDAFDFGVEVGRVRALVFGVSAALVGVSVSAGGSVGYVGLIVPHLVRMMVGSDNRNVIPLAAIGGATFVVLADTIARVAIAPRELPVGAITALLGAPLFIYLLRK